MNGKLLQPGKKKPAAGAGRSKTTWKSWKKVKIG
jgi:hypothetical protein